MSSAHPATGRQLKVSGPPPMGVGLTAGELMGFATPSARQLLGRSSVGDGASLVAGWSQVLDAASEILDATGPATRSAQRTALRQGLESGSGLAVGVTVATMSQLRLEAEAFGAGAVSAPEHPDLNLRQMLATLGGPAVAEQLLQQEWAAPPGVGSPHDDGDEVDGSESDGSDEAPNHVEQADWYETLQSEEAPAVPADPPVVKAVGRKAAGAGSQAAARS